MLGIREGPCGGITFAERAESESSQDGSHPPHIFRHRGDPSDESSSSSDQTPELHPRARALSPRHTSLSNVTRSEMGRLSEQRSIDHRNSAQRNSLESEVPELERSGGDLALAVEVDRSDGTGSGQTGERWQPAVSRESSYANSLPRPFVWSASANASDANTQEVRTYPPDLPPGVSTLPSSLEQRSVHGVDPAGENFSRSASPDLGSDNNPLWSVQVNRGGASTLVLPASVSVTRVTPSSRRGSPVGNRSIEPFGSPIGNRSIENGGRSPASALASPREARVINRSHSPPLVRSGARSPNSNLGVPLDLASHLNSNLGDANIPSPNSNLGAPIDLSAHVGSNLSAGVSPETSFQTAGTHSTESSGDRPSIDPPPPNLLQPRSPSDNTRRLRTNLHANNSLRSHTSSGNTDGSRTNLLAQISLESIPEPHASLPEIFSAEYSRQPTNIFTDPHTHTYQNLISS